MRPYARLLEQLLTHHRTVLVAGALLLALAVAGLPALRIYVELDSMLPEDSEITRTIRVARTAFGPTDYVVIGLTHERGSALDADGAALLVRVHEQLAALPGVKKADVVSLASDRVRHVASINGDARIERVLRDAGDWPGALDRARASPISASLLSRDGRSSLLLLRIVEPPEGKRRFIETLRERLEAMMPAGFRVVVGGQPSVFAALERYSQNVFLVLPFTLLLIGLIHFEAFRSLQGLIFPLVTAGASAGVATTVMNLFGLRIDGFNSAAPIVIVALTAGHAVQMLKRFNEALLAAITAAQPQTSDDWLALNRVAIERSFVAIAPVMVAASLVAAASFASLMVFRMPVIRSFGLYAAVGILAGLVIELIFIPALRLAFPARQRPICETRAGMWDRIVAACARCADPARRRRTVLLGSLLLAACGWLGANVRVDNSVEEYFAYFTGIRKTERELNERYAGSSVFYVLLQGREPDALTSAPAANLMRTIADDLRQQPMIGAVSSYADAAGEVACAFEPDYCKAGPLAWSTAALRQFLALYEAGAGAEALDDYLNPTRDTAVIRVLASTDSSRYVDRLFRDLHARYDAQLPPGISLLLGGTGATTLALNQRFIEMKLANIVQMLGIAAVVASLLFRSIQVGLLVLVPLVASTTFAFAVMTLTGIPLNVATVFIAAVSVGIGADYAIYFGMRLREFLCEPGISIDTAVAQTYATAGKAALFVASAVAGGYLGLVASIGYNVHLWLGVMVAVAMLASVIAALTLFPALLLSLRPKAIFGLARRDSADGSPRAP